MAEKKKPAPKPDEIPWTPDKPLPDEDDEKETSRRAMATARHKYLESQHMSSFEQSEQDKKKGAKKKSSLW